MGSAHRALFALITAGIAVGAAAAPPQEVNFDSLDRTPIKAWVFQPAQQPPRGAVVALHGCGGLYATSGARRGLLNARHQAMADLLVEQGYAAVFPDSLKPRGESELCTQKIGTRRVTGTQRRADALAALNWVSAQPWADAQRMALLGWSHGGSAVLAATDANRRDVTAQPVRAATAVAFYPGCSDALKSGWRPHVPVHVMIGADDDWTPAAPCVALGQAAGIDVTVYAGSYHDFDNPVGEVRLRSDVPNGLNPGQGVHAGRNPVARAQAYARLLQLFEGAFR